MIYVYISYTYVYIPIDRFVSSLCLVPTRVPSRLSVLFRAPPVAHRQACSLSLTRKDGKCTLLFSPPPTVQAFGNARLLRSSRSYFRLSSLSLSINFSSFFSPSPSFLSLRKIFFSFLPSQSDTSLTTLLAD